MKFDNVKQGVNKDALMMMAMTQGCNQDMNPMMFMLMGDKMSTASSNPFMKRFLPTEIKDAGMSFDGTIVLKGHAVSIDEEGNCTTKTTEGMEISMPLLSIPAQASQISRGDIVEVEGEYIAVKNFTEETGQLAGLTIGKNEVTTRILSTSVLGGHNIKKVFNPFSNNNKMDPMMAMLLMGDL